MGGKAAAGWRLKGAFSARCGAARSAEGYDARGGGAAAGRVEAGGGGGGWAAAIRGGGGGEAGSYRVLVSQKWEASEAKMPPGSAAPLGRRAEEGRPALSPPPYLPPPFSFPFPRLPRRQAPPARGVSAAPGSLRARQGPRGAEAMAAARKWRCQALVVLLFSSPRRARGRALGLGRETTPTESPERGFSAVFRRGLPGQLCLGPTPRGRRVKQGARFEKFP